MKKIHLFMLMLLRSLSCAFLLCSFSPVSSQKASIEVPIEVVGNEKLGRNLEFRAIIRNVNDSSMVSISKYEQVTKKRKNGGKHVILKLKDLDAGKYLIEGYVVEIIPNTEGENFETRSANHDSVWAEIDLTLLEKSDENETQQVFRCEKLVIPKRKEPKATTKFTFTL